MFVIILAAIFFAVLFIYATKRQRKIDLQRAEQSKADVARAQELGMTRNVSAHDADIYERDTDENYSGTTEGIEWQLLSREIYDRAHRRGHTWASFTRWSTSSTRVPEGKFILLMRTPSHENKEVEKPKGLLGGLQEKLAEGLLDFYVKGYFGDFYIPLINAKQQKTVLISELSDFHIVTNDEPLATRILNTETIKFIANWVSHKPSFTDDAKVSMFGVLMADSLILSCQTRMASANEVKAFSDFGAGVARLMQDAQKN
jgi:hypothetical protein